MEHAFDFPKIFCILTPKFVRVTWTWVVRSWFNVGGQKVNEYSITRYPTQYW